MNRKAQKKHSQHNPKGKVTRDEVGRAFQQAANDINQTRVVLTWLADFLLEKGVFTQEELNAFFSKRQAEATAATQAALNPPPAETPCATPNVSSPSSSTPTTA